jgi:hypothetical protein
VEGAHGDAAVSTLRVVAAGSPPATGTESGGRAVFVLGGLSKRHFAELFEGRAEGEVVLRSACAHRSRIPLDELAGDECVPLALGAEPHRPFGFGERGD